MPGKLSKLSPIADTAGGQAGIEVGKLVGVTETGVALIQREADGPILEARSVLTVHDDRLKELEATPLDVLLVFEENDYGKPIVAGIINDGISENSNDQVTVEMNGTEQQSARVDGRRVVLDAREEIELRCGHSSIILKRNGYVTIKGAKIVSRSSGPNKIKGASVNIN